VDFVEDGCCPFKTMCLMKPNMYFALESVFFFEVVLGID